MTRGERGIEESRVTLLIGFLQVTQFFSCHSGHNPFGAMLGPETLFAGEKVIRCRGGRLSLAFLCVLMLGTGAAGLRREISKGSLAWL